MISKKFFKTKDEADVTFQFSRPDVSSAAIAGEFNNWQPEAMKFDKKDSAFKIKLRLPKDEHFEFKYLLNDEEWENDYAADSYKPNSMGSENSVISTFSG